jgi:hypothetical protein
MFKCYDTGETSLTYKDYLNTKHWINIKSKYKRTVKNECIMCGSNKQLNIHHMNYKNIGNEKFSDLCFLCEECHNKLHKELGDNYDSEFLFYIKKIKKEKHKSVNNIDCKFCIDYHKKKCLLGNNKNTCKSFKRKRIK